MENSKFLALFTFPIRGFGTDFTIHLDDQPLRIT